MTDTTQTSPDQTIERSQWLTRLSTHRQSIAYVIISLLVVTDKGIDFSTKRDLNRTAQQQAAEIITLTQATTQARQEIANLHAGLTAMLDSNSTVLQALADANTANARTAGGASKDSVIALTAARNAQAIAREALRKRNGEPE